MEGGVTENKDGNREKTMRLTKRRKRARILRVCWFGFFSSRRIRRDKRGRQGMEGGWQINKSAPSTDLSFWPEIKRVSSDHSTAWKLLHSRFSTFVSPRQRSPASSACRLIRRRKTAGVSRGCVSREDVLFHRIQFRYYL